VTLSFGSLEAEMLAGIFVSYTSSDRDWAFWIGKELEKLGHTPYIHDWEIRAGEDIVKWMEERLGKADHALLVVSSKYFEGEYSNWERRSAEWAMQRRPGFALPVYVEKCEEPLLLANFKRCDLYRLDEDRARAALAAYLKEPAPPEVAPFPVRARPAQAPPRSPDVVPFPGKPAKPLDSPPETAAASRGAPAVTAIAPGQMKAHIVGGGFGGLAAAALLIQNAGVPGQDITIYETDDGLGGGFFLSGNAQSGYNLPGSLFDKEFRCAFALLARIPTRADPNISVTDQFFAFNRKHPFIDQMHIVDRDLRRVHDPLRYGLTLADGMTLAKLSLTSEASLDGQLIKDWFPQRFFDTEFWLLWSTIVKSLPQHSAIEFRRYIHRFIFLLHDMSIVGQALRSPFNQNEALIKPLVAWLRPRGVNFLTEAFVRDIGFAPSPQMTVNRLDYERDSATRSVAIGPKDIVLVTIGSQAADLSVGSMIAAPKLIDTGRSWALWKRLSTEHKGFGNPDAFFGADRIADSCWVTFTVTTTGAEFIDQTIKLTRNDLESGARLILKDSSWVLSLSIFREREIRDQPEGTFVWWGYGLFPQRNGDFVKKRMDRCTGAEILQEVLFHLRFDQKEAIIQSSICNPCNLPYVNNIWLPRKSGDRPPVIPQGATNLGLIGQYVEVPQDVAFTIEYSTRTAWEAVYRLVKRGPPPPDVYQGQFDLQGVWAATKMFVGLTKT
jgi:oleate hydratase